MKLHPKLFMITYKNFNYFLYTHFIATHFQFSVYSLAMSFQNPSVEISNGIDFFPNSITVCLNYWCTLVVLSHSVHKPCFHPSSRFSAPERCHQSVLA